MSERDHNFKIDAPAGSPACDGSGAVLTDATGGWREKTQLRVLHLEDKREDAELIHSALEQDGLSCSFVVAQSKEQFQSALEHERFDLILSDYALPDYDGMKALRMVREKQLDTPFILVSGTLGEEQAVESLKCGATDYILKTRLVRLSSAVLRALREAEARNQHRQAEQDLHAREESFRALTNNSPDAIARLDHKLRFVYCNPALTRSAGMDFSDLVGKTWEEAGLTPLPEWEDALRKVLQTGVEATVDFSVNTNAGLKFFEARLVPESGEGGKVQFVLAVTRDVTRIRSATEELRDRLALQDRLTKIAATVPGIIYAFRLRPDGSSCIPYASPTIEEFYGVRAEDLVDDASTVFSLIHPEDKAHVQASIAESGRTMTPWRDQFRINHPRKGCFWIEGQSTPERETDGGILWHGFMSDITERKQIEEALRRETAFFEALVDSSLDGILVVNGQQQQIVQNDQFQKLLKIPSNIVGQQDDRERLDHVVNSTKHPSHFRERVAYLYSHPDETGRDEIEFKDGTVLDRYSAPVRGKDGKHYGRIWMFRDITERKRVEASLLQLSSAIAQSADNVIITTKDGDIVYANPAVLSLTGYAKEELIGKTPRILKSSHHDPAFHKNLWETLLAGNSFRGEFVNRKKNGDTFFEEKTITPVFDSSGAISHFVATGRDITARKESEARLAETQKKMVELSHQAGMAEVATGVLHNVGNVLNSVNVAAHCLADGLRKSKSASLAKVAILLREHESDLGEFMVDDPKGKILPGYLTQLADHLAIEQAAALEELAHLQKNIEHIKDIVTMQQGFAKVSGLNESIQVNELMEDALSMNASSLNKHHVTVLKEFAAVPPVTIQKHKVLQILVNLVRNAQHACEDSGRDDKQMALRIMNNEKHVRISVSDNGVGIAPENLTRIFAHGFTTRKDGHGFGLHSGAIAAKEMGGRLDAQSEGVGCGATFVLELPLQTQDCSQ